ncbi:MAG: hypothetical protein HWN51_05815 [Desulfobacterales bacterium]|nr:hypothetical protein [Desulfobacterales bacterium]
MPPGPGMRFPGVSRIDLRVIGIKVLGQCGGDEKEQAEEEFQFVHGHPI